METNQTFINQFVDDNYEAILDRLATKMQEASEIPVVDYNSLKHQAVLMQYVWEGVHQIQAVSPNSYLADALALVTAAVNRANAALQDIEDANAAISDAEDLRALAETARANAETARNAAEELRAAAETARASAENDRALAETARANAEELRAAAETARSGWFNTFKATVESWYSSPDDGTGILQIWNAFKSSADTWMSLAQSAWNSFFGATAESEGGVRKIWSTWLASAQSAYQSLTSSMNAAETARADAETARNTAETDRDNAETARAAAETTRDTNEQTRQANEGTRQTQEQTRQSQEGERSVAEGLRSLAESDREDAEEDREDAETARQSAYNTLMQNLQALYQEMLSRNNHPAQFGEDGYIYQWDVALQQYVRTEHFWKQFSSFHISKEFASIAAMNAYDPTDLPQGEYPLEVSDFVIIKSNPEDPDNSKLYSYSGENEDDDPDFERFHYLGDFSGAQGFQGKTPQLSIGTVLAGNPGTQPSVSLTADGQDADGNPRFLINFTIPRGADGRGIASMTQVTRSNVSGGENVWRATFTDGATADLIVLNGEQGANAGIGEATATVDSGVGTPSVNINTGGTNANRIFSFSFHNLKGATFTPSVDANGNLSWTNDGGLTNPTSFNIISAIPLATQLQQGLMSDADKEKLDNSLPLASNQVSALTAANALAQNSGKTVFWGSQDNDGKWTLQKMSPEELQKLAYEYMKSSSILSEYASLLGVQDHSETIVRLGCNLWSASILNWAYSGLKIKTTYPYIIIEAHIYNYASVTKTEIYASNSANACKIVDTSLVNNGNPSFSLWATPNSDPEGYYTFWINMYYHWTGSLLIYLLANSMESEVESVRADTQDSGAIKVYQR